MVTVIHLITGLETGGAERMLSHLVARTDRHRFRSVVVSMTDAGKLGPIIDAAGVETLTLGVQRGIPDPRGLLRLDRILRERRPEILQTWLYHADFLGLVEKRLGRVPHLVWNVRCSNLDIASVSLGGAGLRHILGWCSRMPEAVVVNSRAGQRFHARIGYRPRRWEYVPNGFDTSEFRPNRDAGRPLRAEIGIGADEIVIGMAARYHPMKDHTTFLDAAARLAATREDVRFVLAGSGIESANRALAEAIAERGLGNHVRLLGERTDMAALYAALDIASLTSALGEGFPNVVGEAMACGVPCAATDNGDTGEIIGKTGIVVPTRNPEALAAAWISLIALGPEGRASLGREARRRIAQNYELGLIVARYEALYEEMAFRSASGQVETPVDTMCEMTNRPGQ
jgi:glycosyltransferase involved in cell wall biosynthesis